jgi:mono/diheme cytochrome c family protein
MMFIRSILTVAFRSAKLALPAFGLCAAIAGCGQPTANFKTNLQYSLNQELQNNAKLGDRGQDIADALAAMFGTPDEPHIPALPELDPETNKPLTSTVLDIDRLNMAAGRVLSDKHGKVQGLYREHCVHCHGITGDGQGPTAAFLNPYPRDYRSGKYKFKSTPVGSRPTHEDLRKTLIEGIPGTAMPSFKLLPADELDALVHYVKYLSIRGEVERSLITTTLSDLSEGDRLIDSQLKDSSDPAKVEAYTGQVNVLKDAATAAFTAWAQAAENITAIKRTEPEVKLTKEQSIARGREIFYTLGGCVKCHGDSALGDGQTTDFDDWTKELQPDKPELLKQYLAVGALEPRNIRPRNLRQGIYRGGRRPIDIYWRVMNGIEGTPMPKLSSTVLQPGEDPDPKKISQDDVWHLIEYVRNMPYEAISQGGEHAPNVQRDRN